MTSGQNFLDHIPGDIGQPFVAAVVPEGEFFVIQAKQVKDGGVKIAPCAFSRLVLRFSVR